MTTRLALALAAALGLSAPLRASDTSPAKAPAAAVTSNPFFAASTLPYAAPPFDRIRDEHYLRNGINSTLMPNPRVCWSATTHAYLWSEVLDADSVEWFRTNGGLTRANGDHFRRTLLSRGGSEDAMKLFGEFRGRGPDIKPLLERRGLAQPKTP